jgi:hypothetical protein
VGDYPDVLADRPGDLSQAFLCAIVPPAPDEAGHSLLGRARDEGAGDGDGFAQAASDAIGPFLILGELALLGDGRDGEDEAIVGAKAALATAVITQALKTATRERRPNSDARDSFPSGHTSSAFAMATVLAEYEPAYRWPAYGVAATIGWSRVKTENHHWHDVVAGAALGYFVARYFVDEREDDAPVGFSLRWEW